jgi:hypothetical protein
MSDIPTGHEVRNGIAHAVYPPENVCQHGDEYISARTGKSYRWDSPSLGWVDIGQSPVGETKIDDPKIDDPSSDVGKGLTGSSDVAAALRDLATVAEFLKTITGKRISIRVTRRGLWVTQVSDPGYAPHIKSKLIDWKDVTDFKLCYQKIWEVV